MENFNIEQRIDERIQNGIKFDFDSFFNNGWNLFKKVFLMIAGAIFIMAVPVMIVYVIMMPFLMGISSFDQYMDIVKDNPYYMQQLQRSPMYLLKQSLMTMIFALISAPINAGMVKLCRDADKGEDLRFGTIFSYYKAPYFGKLLVTVLITAFITSACSFAFSFIPILGTFLNLGAVLVVYVMFAYVQPLIIFANADLGKAFSMSFKLAGKTFLSVLGFSLLFGLLCGVGIIGCCIGIFFTAAFIPVCHYLIYKYGVGFPEDELTQDETPHWQQQPPSI
jgi:hypothetical protein